MAQRAQALACFLAPALFVLAYILHAARIGLWASAPVFNDGDLKLEFALVEYWASLLMIPAWFALAQLVGQKAPRLAVICAVLGLAGLGPFITGAFLDLNVAVVVRNGFPMNSGFFINADWLNTGAEITQVMPGVCQQAGRIVLCGSPGVSAEQLLVGLPIVLYFIANLMLGVAVLRGGVLPRWSGVLLIAFALLQFDSTGPQLSGVPLFTGLLAALCLVAVYWRVGLRLWRGAAETAIMELHRPTAQA
jgi:hypothetical protein